MSHQFYGNSYLHRAGALETSIPARSGGQSGDKTPEFDYQPTMGLHVVLGQSGELESDKAAQ